MPQGTVIEVSGRASTALRAVYIKSERDSIAFTASGHAFLGRLRPAGTSRYEWFAIGANAPIADVPLPIEIEVIPDSAPRVELVSPPTDTIVATVAPTVAANNTKRYDHGMVSADGGGSNTPVSTRTSITEAIIAVAELSATTWDGLVLGSQRIHIRDSPRRIRGTVQDAVSGQWARIGRYRSTGRIWLTLLKHASLRYFRWHCRKSNVPATMGFYRLAWC